MSAHTPIHWCDSSVNPVMGCDGCELWRPNGIKECYAGAQHEKRAGLPGFADRFLEPKMFAGRMAAAARWRDLRGKTRPDKPWIPPELPRLVFISDMGDALSKDVSFEFLRDEIVLVVAAWKHIGLWLTKQARRMVAFAEWLAAQGIAWPPNLWAGTSVTGRASVKRVAPLCAVPAVRRFISFEPLFDDPGPIDLTGIHWAIAGGFSATKDRITDIAWLRSKLAEARAAGAAPFIKQLGSAPVDGSRQLVLDDQKHGGDWSEWPDDLRVREYPKEP